MIIDFSEPCAHEETSYLIFFCTLGSETFLRSLDLVCYYSEESIFLLLLVLMPSLTAGIKVNIGAIRARA